ncbi:Plug domain-containing protein [Flavobacteriaceae bacterium]|nr:Plug domain-containing protein [Flavobacteriaceae bacterium]
MKLATIFYFIFLISIFQFSFGQQDSIKTQIDKKESKKERRNKSNRTRKTINYDANSLWDAIRPVLGANIFLRDGKAIINTGTFFATGNNFILWVVDGVILGDQIPNNINIYDIDNIQVLRRPIETEKYGFRGSSGVIEIKLKTR